MNIFVYNGFYAFQIISLSWNNTRVSMIESKVCKYFYGFCFICQMDFMFSESKSESSHYLASQC
jgi:hypothetical protein